MAVLCMQLEDASVQEVGYGMVCTEYKQYLPYAYHLGTLYTGTPYKMYIIRTGMNGELDVLLKKARLTLTCTYVFPALGRLSTVQFSIDYPNFPSFDIEEAVPGRERVRLASLHIFTYVLHANPVAKLSMPDWS